jgi:hypothetical protein
MAAPVLPAFPLEGDKGTAPSAQNVKVMERVSRTKVFEATRLDSVLCILTALQTIEETACQLAASHVVLPILANMLSSAFPKPAPKMVTIPVPVEGVLLPSTDDIVTCPHAPD